MNNKSHIFWLTGMSGTGKTTLSSIVKTELEKRKFSVEIVYGDKAREKYEIPLGFDRKDIEKIIF